jgi:hypothetical protein
MIKTTGAEWKRFYTDDTYWPDGAWWDDGEVRINGEEADSEVSLSEIPDDCVITVDGGVVIRPDNDDDISIEEYFNLWKKQQTTVTFVVDVPKEHADAVRAAVTFAGGVVVDR